MKAAPWVLNPGAEMAIAWAEREMAGCEERSPRWDGLKHAAYVMKVFTRVPRALLQLQKHAEFTRDPEKAKAYREAFAALEMETGESPCAPPRADDQEPQFSF